MDELDPAGILTSAALFIVGLFLILIGKSNSDEEFSPEPSKIKTFVMAIFVLTSVSIIGFFSWEYYTHDRYVHEGIFWSATGIGYHFGEDDIRLYVPSSEDCDGDWESDGEGLCSKSVLDEDGKKIEWRHKVSHTRDGHLGEKLCLIDESEEECSFLFFRADGIILTPENEAYCIILVRDIIAPPSIMDEDFEDEIYNDEEREWLKEFWEKGTEIYDEVPDELCDYYLPSAISDPDYWEDRNEEEEEDYDWTNDYEWSHADALDGGTTMSSGDDDALVEITMDLGSDLNWAMLRVQIKVDGGTTYDCDLEDEFDSCTYTLIQGSGDDQKWEASEGITISEGDTDLCDGSNGGCNIRVTITDVGSDVVIGIINAYANGYN
jgi:hypothetical protein